MIQFQLTDTKDHISLIFFIHFHLKKKEEKSSKISDLFHSISILYKPWDTDWQQAINTS